MNEVTFDNLPELLNYYSERIAQSEVTEASQERPEAVESTPVLGSGPISFGIVMNGQFCQIWPPTEEGCKALQQCLQEMSESTMAQES